MKFLHLSDLVTLIIQIPLGVALYFVFSKLFKIDSLDYVLLVAKEFIMKKKHQGSDQEIKG